MHPGVASHAGADAGADASADNTADAGADASADASADTGDQPMGVWPVRLLLHVGMRIEWACV